jgi:glycosyltransferase involved in cell wall biosynthesis
MRYDVIIVKDEFSLITTLVCRLLGKKIIYKDSMFQMPTRFWKRWSVFMNLRMASTIICYSKHQAKVWEKRFKLKDGVIKTLHYCVDTTFYPEIEYKPPYSQHAISVGRDPGRDYICLSRAVQINHLNTVLVTLQYLLSEEIKSNKNIKIFERLSYARLFELYSDSFISVVPLCKDLDYPTGIRAVLESQVLGIPVIATRTPVLVEYFEENEEIIFVDADDEGALASAMREISSNDQLAYKISNAGKTKARSLYNMQNYSKDFENILISTINS